MVKLNELIATAAPIAMSWSTGS